MTTKKTATKRTIRTPEQMIADLEAEIARVKARAAAKEARASDDGKAFMAAVRGVDKTMDAAKEAENDAMLHALESARATLGEQLIAMGLRAPAPRRRGGREAAA